MRHPKSGRGKRQGRGPRIPAAVLRKQQAAAPNVDQVTGAKIPKSFVFSRGKVPSTLRHLQLDLRKVMLPYTALNLKVYILLLHIPLSLPTSVCSAYKLRCWSLKQSAGEEAEQPQGLSQCFGSSGCDAFHDPIEPQEPSTLAHGQDTAGPDLHVPDRGVCTCGRHR
jgi:hypothetical protein